MFVSSVRLFGFSRYLNPLNYTLKRFDIKIDNINDNFQNKEFLIKFKSRAFLASQRVKI